MRKFQDIYELAVIHKGGVDALEALLPQAATADRLRSLSDDVYLSTMSRRIFRAGLKHSLVDAKWDYFEKVFHGFDPFFCAMLSDEDIENLMTDKGLIRHLGKIKSIRLNGQFVRSVAQDYGSFADYLVQFSHAELIDLWSQLKKFTLLHLDLYGLAWQFIHIMQCVMKELELIFLQDPLFYQLL